MKIGDAQGYPTKPNLGRPPMPSPVIVRRAKSMSAWPAADTAYLPDLADYYRRFAGLVRFTGGAIQARDVSEKAIETLDRIRVKVAPISISTEVRAALCTLGDMDEDLGRYSLALQEFSRCGGLARAELKANGSREPYQRSRWPRSESPPRPRKRLLTCRAAPGRR